MINKSALLINYIQKDENQPAGADYLLYPPLGLACLSAYLKKYGCRVEVLDAIALDLTEDQIIEKIRNNGFDLVGFTVYTSQVVSLLDLCRKIKERCREVKIVLGGPHVFHCHEELLRQNDFVDYCVRGEGEQILLDLTQALEEKSSFERIKGLSYRVDGKVIINEPRELIADLDSLPFPDREQLPNHLYCNVKFMGPATGKFNCITISRGCPFRCKYCASSGQWQGRCRIRSVDNVIEEIKELQAKYGVEVLRFNDDLVTWRKNWLLEFCEKIIVQRIKIKWYCDARVDTIDLETLKMMKKAGCECLQYGIEFGNESIRRLAGKSFSNQKALDAVKMARKAGIPVFGLFMVGYPGETEATVMETIEFAVKSGVNWAAFHIVTPFPGTELFSCCLENNLLKSTDWKDYNKDKQESVIKLEYISDQRLSELLDLAFKRFYFRPSYMIHRLFHISSFYDFISALSLVKRIFFPANQPD